MDVARIVDVILDDLALVATSEPNERLQLTIGKVELEDVLI
jgi:hypothetical protein